MKKTKYLFLLITSLLFSCNYSTTNKKREVAKDSVILRYAKGFKIKYFDKYKQVEVINPQKKGKNIALYYLVSNDSIQTPKDGQKIIIPITKLASSSVTHLEFLQLLAEIKTIKGFCNPKLAYNQFIRENRENIIDLGDELNINIEKTIALRPQALMITAYNQNNPNIERLQKVGIPIIYNNEWQENHILGRAEWIKFIAVFFNKEKEVETIFNKTVENYNRLKNIAEKSKYRPTIVTGNNFKGTWYLPSGKSYMNQLFKDANANYYYANDTTSKASLPLNIEIVLKHFSNADIWLNCNFNSYEELLSADEKHSLFKAVSNKKIYNFYKRKLPSGANDYWEGAIAHPDKLLGDFIAIIHPELLPNWEFNYTKKLNNAN